MVSSTSFTRKSWFIKALICYFIFGQTCLALEGDKKDKFEGKSIVQLIADPEKFDNRKIETVGWLWFDHRSAEPSAYIFLTKEDMNSANIYNGIVATVSKSYMTANLDLHKKMVSIKGTFRKQRGEGLLHNFPIIVDVGDIKEQQRPAFLDRK